MELMSSSPPVPQLGACMFEAVTRAAPTDASLLPSPAPLHDPRLSVSGQGAPVPWLRTKWAWGQHPARTGDRGSVLEQEEPDWRWV